MSTPADLVAVAHGEIGTTEHPRGTNRSKYGAWFGMNGVPWCSIFVAWCADRCGINVRRIVTPGYASCELALVGYRGKGWTVPQSATQPGDVVFFQFDRDRAADHTGIVESVTGGRLVTIEGNTGHGNDTNGGAVMRRERQWSQVKGIGRIPFDATLPTLVDPAQIPTISPDEEDDDMPGFIMADTAGRWWNTDGILRRYVATPANAKVLVFLGQARNEVTSAGDVVVRQAPTGFLDDIPVANPLMERVECNIGGPAQLDVVGARHGSRWLLPWVLTLDDGEGDGSTVTGAKLALKPLNGDDDTETVLTVDATIVSAEVGEVVGYFEVPLDDTPDVAAGAYAWDWELEATDELLNGWAPTSGVWRVPERVVVRTEGS